MSCIYGPHVVLGFSLLQVPDLLGNVSVNDTTSQTRSNGIKYCVTITSLFFHQTGGHITKQTSPQEHNMKSLVDLSCHVLDAICLKNDLPSISTITLV